jgi:hypothetical protein
MRSRILLAGAQSSENQMSDYNELIRRYVALWNETDPAQRRRRIAELWHEDGLHANRRDEWRGHERMMARVTGSYEKSIRDGGYRFEPAAPAEGYRNVVRFTWHMRPQGGGPVAAQGFELLVLASDGRIAADYQFLDPTPA